MAICKNCGKTLILRGGKCFYCEQNPYEVSVSSKSNQNPYTNYMGQNYIYGASNDPYGNPLGSQYDFGKDGAFYGYKIVTMETSIGVSHIKPYLFPLKQKGFDIIEISCYNYEKLKEEVPNNKSQLWLFLDTQIGLIANILALIYEYYIKGHGIFIYTAARYNRAANEILKDLFDTEMIGDYTGGKVLSVKSPNNTSGIVKNHPITTGIQQLYEGGLITNIKLKNGLMPLSFSSNGEVLTAYYDKDGKKAVIHGSSLSYLGFHDYEKAGINRFFVNIACWLAIQNNNL